ncbi:MAG TPA: hypothetical protein VMV49_04985 [Candidatus Deferrimicrobium sp.]|nr:hypothetical protein [Candidatus Deferrimicrobium sp.]
MELDQKERLKKLLESLEGSQGEDWKEVISNNRDEFERIKREIKEKQKDLANFVKKKSARLINDEDFESKTQRIQQELYDLESKILKLRIIGKK